MEYKSSLFNSNSALKNEPDFYCFTDFETNGLDYQKDQITEFGIVKTDRAYKVIDEFNGFVKLEPGRYLPSHIIELTGITKKDLDSGMSLSEAKAYIYSWLDNSMVIAHNATFDLGFIQDVIRPDFICTRTIHAVKFPDCRHRLEDIVKQFNLAPTKPHRALNDARSVYELYRMYVKLYGQEGINLFRNKLVSFPDRPFRYMPPNAKVIL